MSPLSVILSFLSGFLTGLFFFHHLFVSVKRSILSGKKELRFWLRYLIISLSALLTVLTFREAFVFFLPGFYISRLTYSFLVLRMGSKDES